MSDDKPTLDERVRATPREAETVRPEPALHEAETEPPRGGSEGMTRPSKRNARQGDRPPPPATRYEGHDEIARGGMGRVIEATDTLLGRTVAVKQALTLDPEMLRRFARETRITARLEHPSIVPVYDAGVDGDAPFYVMRRVSGRPLSELIVASSRLEERLALVPNLLAAAQAVAHAHSRGIIHRDIKPANILIGDFGETVVIDWGLAKVVDEPDDDDPVEQSPADSLRTRAGTVFGTPGYMSPGQLRGDPVGPAADVYALGASLYFLLGGRPPHHAPTGDAMMVLAAKGPPKPLVELVPGVPRELATIVDTALAYGSTTYRDAGDLVADLQRFSTGQLVASHRYSAGERLVRLIRRHRAAFAIGLAALIVIAIGATISIQRVIAERDRADQRAAEAAAAQRSERERADQLLLLRARNLIETNPTESLAVLKEIRPDSPRIAEAHTIANAAIMQGPAWAMPGPETASTMAELDPQGKRLLVVDLRGELHLWDLERRTRIRSLKLGGGVRAVWIRDGVLVHGRHATAWLDPETGRLEPLALPVLEFVASSRDQTRIAAITAARELVILDLEARSVRVLSTEKFSGVAVAGNGSWIAGTTFQPNGRAIVFAPDGRELGRRDGDYSLIAASQTRRLAMNEGRKVIEAEVDTASVVWKEVDFSSFGAIGFVSHYEAESLHLTIASGEILRIHDGKPFKVAHVERGFRHAFESGDDTIVVSTDNTLTVIGSFESRRMSLPQPMATVRTAARPDRSRFAVVGAGIIVVYEREAIAPKRLLSPQHRVDVNFFDEDTLLISDQDTSTLFWYDLANQQRTPIEGWFPGLTHDVLTHRRRADAVFDTRLGATFELYSIARLQTKPRKLYEGASGLAFGLHDQGVVVGDGPRLKYEHEGRVRDLATLDSNVTKVLAVDGRFVAVSEAGELVRGALDGSALERVRLTRPQLSDLLTPSTDPVVPALTLVENEPVIAWGKQLWTWGERLEPLAEVEAPVVMMTAFGNGVVTLAPNTRTMRVDLDTKRVAPLPTHLDMVLISANRSRALIHVGRSYQAVEARPFTSWPTTIPHVSSGVPSLSPSGKKAVLSVPGSVLLWNVPAGEGPLRPRLELHTNAVIDAQGALAWPWQH